MGKETGGIHHITAIVGDPQENVDFYADVLGLRLVKKTVNFDDPGTYHLYFGNETGRSGSIMTFFPWAGAYKGRIGSGQVGITSFVVPVNALDFWEERLTAFNVSYSKTKRFNEDYLQFDDPHGLHLELVARKEGSPSHWTLPDITPDVAVKGFGGAVLNSAQPNKTAELLSQGMGLQEVGQEGDYLRFRSNGDIGNVIDIKLTASPRGIMGVGTVHHIAWRTKDDRDQQNWQAHLSQLGYQPTEIKDRQYFKSIYFLEGGGILFEMATDTPGFDRDEALDELGEALMLPPWLEPHRDKIENALKPVKATYGKENS